MQLNAVNYFLQNFSFANQGGYVRLDKEKGCEGSSYLIRNMELKTFDNRIIMNNKYVEAEFWEWMEKGR